MFSCVALNLWTERTTENKAIYSFTHCLQLKYNNSVARFNNIDYSCTSFQQVNHLIVNFLSSSRKAKIFRWCRTRRNKDLHVLLLTVAPLSVCFQESCWINSSTHWPDLHTLSTTWLHKLSLNSIYLLWIIHERNGLTANCLQCVCVCVFLYLSWICFCVTDAFWGFDWSPKKQMFCSHC